MGAGLAEDEGDGEGWGVLVGTQGAGGVVGLGGAGG